MPRTNHHPAAPKPKPPTNPEELSEKAKSLFSNSVSLDTQRRKRRAVAHYLEWCFDNGIKRQQAMPASEATLCNYAASFGGTHAGGTARAKLSALKGYHHQKGMVWNGDARLRKVLSGVERAAPASSFRAERMPVKEEWLGHLGNELDLSGDNGLDTAVFAAANTHFFGQMRLGEGLPDSSDANAYDSSKQPIVRDLTEMDKGAQKLHLPSTKTQQKRGESVTLSPRDGPLDPTSANRTHILHNNLAPSDPLFAYRNAAGTLVCLTRKVFLDRCNEIWARHGIERITGHSFRIGGTTYFLLAGVSPDVVKALGRWKSDAFLKYWRNLESLASIHLHRHHAQQTYGDKLKSKER